MCLFAFLIKFKKKKKKQQEASAIRNKSNAKIEEAECQRMRQQKLATQLSEQLVELEFDSKRAVLRNVKSDLSLRSKPVGEVTSLSSKKSFGSGGNKKLKK